MRRRILTILHTNDLHARYDQWLIQAGYIRERKRIIEEEWGEKCLLLDGGDHFDMSVDECFATRGRLSLRMLEELGCHASAVGNNEIDRGTPELMRELSRETKVPWLLTNLREADGRLIGGCRDHLLIDLGDGLKVGLFGGTDQGGTYYETKYGYRNADSVTVYKEAIAKLKAQGANVIVFLSHMGYEQDLEMARALSGEVDIICGGHSHTVLEQPVMEAGVAIIQGGSFGRYVNEWRFEWDPEREGLDGYSGRLTSMEERPHLQPDEAQSLLLQEGREETERVFSEVLAELPEPLTHVQTADRVAAVLKEHWQAEVGLIFGAVAQFGFEQGPLTLGHVFRNLKSFMTPALYRMPGSQLLALLRESHDPEIAGRPLYGRGLRPNGIAIGRIHWAGVTWTPDENGLPARVHINGEPLQPDRLYTVGSVTHLNKPENNGYPSSGGAELLDAAPLSLARDLFIESVKKVRVL